MAKLATSHAIYGASIKEVHSLLLKVGSSADLTLNDIEEWNDDFIEKEEEFPEIEDDDESDVEVAKENEKVQ